MSEAAGNRFGGFEILRKISAGSEGSVFEAVCRDSSEGIVAAGTAVALKVMPAGDDSARTFAKLSKRTQELKGMSHPNIVRYYGCFAAKGGISDYHIVVQELLKGETLKDVLSRHPFGLDVDKALDIAKAAASGLGYAASKGIFHRDVKPANIFICGDGQTKIIDFEIAKQARDGTQTETVDNIRGTFDYLAPDFIERTFRGDEQSDVFSLGVVVHEMFSGRTPYPKSRSEGRSADFSYFGRWSGTGGSGENSPIDISPRVKRMLSQADIVLSKALQRERNNRYGSFASFYDALCRIRLRHLENPGSGKDYQILQYIGKGGFGEVFKGRERDSGRIVAIKHLLRQDYLWRFETEAKTLARLEGPYFVKYIDHFKESGVGHVNAFLVMDFLEGMPGSSLRDAIKASGGSGLDAKAVLVAFRRYALGLSAMHKGGVFHRDIKPSNLYFPPDRPDQAAIMDFGIVRDANGSLTAGDVPGTLDFMPPEIIDPVNRGDERMDIYALGLCLFEALTGRMAYGKLSAGAPGIIEFRKRAESREKPSLGSPSEWNFAPELLDLIKSMTDIDWRRRMSDARDVAGRIKRVLDKYYPSGDLGKRPADERETSGTEVLQGDDLDKLLNRPRRPLRPRPVLKLFRTIVKIFALASLCIAVWYVYKTLARPDSVPGPDAAAPLTLPPEPIDGGNTLDASEDEDPPGSPEDERILESPDNEIFSESAEVEKRPEPPDGEKTTEATDGGILEKLNNAIENASEAMKDEPVEGRGNRLYEAMKELNGEIKIVESEVGKTAETSRARELVEEIKARQIWYVGRIENRCGMDVRVDDEVLKADEVRVFVFKDPKKYSLKCSVKGYAEIAVPPSDFDEKTFKIEPAMLEPSDVVLKTPEFQAGIQCKIDGETASGFKKVKPGSHEYEYERADYLPQSGNIDVPVGVDCEAPPPGKWMPTPALESLVRAEEAANSKDWRTVEAELENCNVSGKDHVRRKEQVGRLLYAERKRLEDERRRKEEERRKLEEEREKERLREIQAKQAEIREQCRKFMSLTPVDTRLQRLREAKSYLEKGRDADIETFGPVAAEFIPAIASNLQVTVCIVTNGLDAPVVVGGEKIASGSSRLFQFDQLLPDDWSCVAEGYEKLALVRDVDGKTVHVTPSMMTPRRVEVALPDLEAGIVCRLDGTQMHGKVAMLRPGRHDAEFERSGYETQKTSFDVLFNTPAGIPGPGEWRPVPVRVGFPPVDAETECILDGIHVAGSMPVLPGLHKWTYAKKDFIPQSGTVAVEPGRPVEIEKPGMWKPSSDLANLEEAEKAAAENRWEAAGKLLEACNVTSVSNMERKRSLKKRHDERAAAEERKRREREDVEKIASKARRFCSQGFWKNGLCAFEDACGKGYKMTGEDVMLFNAAYDNWYRQLYDLRRQVADDIGKGRRPARKIEDIDDEINKLPGMKTRVTGR